MCQSPNPYPRARRLLSQPPYHPSIASFEREFDTTSPALGLLPPTDQALCPCTAETCKGTKPKESSPPQERYDMPPTDQDLFSAYFDDDLFDDG